MILSICIPTYNRKESLEKNLKSLLPLLSSNDFEVIISDNCSTDNTVEFVNTFINQYKLSNVRLFSNMSNIGPDKNFTTVLAYSSGKYSLLLGDDDLLNISSVIKLVDILRNNDFSFVFLAEGNNSFKALKPDDMAGFLVSTGVNITFMSRMVFYTKIIQEIIESPFYYKDNLIQSYLAIHSILASSKIGPAIFSNKIFDENGATSAENYDFYKVFVVHLFDLFSFALGTEDMAFVRKVYKQAVCSFLIKFSIILKCLRIKTHIRKDSFAILKHYCFFWFFLLPIHLVPSLFYRPVYAVRKKFKRSKNK